MHNLLETSSSHDDTRAIGRRLARELVKDKQNVFLFGGLGAGKTTLLKGLGEGLGIDEEIISPSFQLVKTYKSRAGVSLIHIDLYRLKNIEEILLLGWTELLEKDGITAVEWADRALEILPEKAVFLNLKYISEKKRSVEVFTEKKDIPGY